MSQPEAEFFYTTENTSRWSNGPHLSTMNPDNGFDRIKSLEEAKALAEKFFVGGYGEDRCVTSYGIRYRIRDEDMIGE